MCGRYNEVRAHRLKDHCPKEPVRGTGYRLKRLRAGKHPTTGKPLGGLAQRLTLGKPVVVTAGDRS